MESNLRELVLEHLEEHGKQVVDSPEMRSALDASHECLRMHCDILLLA